MASFQLEARQAKPVLVSIFIFPEFSRSLGAKIEVIGIGSRHARKRVRSSESVFVLLDQRILGCLDFVTRHRRFGTAIKVKYLPDMASSSRLAQSRSGCLLAAQISFCHLFSAMYLR